VSPWHADIAWLASRTATVTDWVLDAAAVVRYCPRLLDPSRRSHGRRDAGFSLNSDNLTGYVEDPWINVTVAAAVIVGGLGFPVVFELARSWRSAVRISLIRVVTSCVVGAPRGASGTDHAGFRWPPVGPQNDAPIRWELQRR